MSSHKLDVPYYRQIDLQHGMNSYWQNRSCGILCVKMIVDFYRQAAGKPATELVEIFEKALANGGAAENGDWLHSTLVKTAKDYGFLAWRRSWKPAERDKEFFRGEGVGEDSITRWQEQAQAEALPSLIAEVARGYPVIVSVAKNFNETEKNHDVVLTGVKGSAGSPEGFYFNDPYSDVHGKDNKDRLVPLEQFNKNWTFRAIFIEPKGAK